MICSCRSRKLNVIGIACYRGKPCYTFDITKTSLKIAAGKEAAEYMKRRGMAVWEGNLKEGNVTVSSESGI